MNRDWLAYFKAKRGMGAVICEGPEIEAACAEIEALLARHNALVEAVAWEREVEWLNDLITEQYACVSEIAPEEEEISVSYFEARSEVDRLIARGNGWRWPAPQQ